MVRLFKERLQKIEKTYEEYKKIEERLESIVDSPRKIIRLKALKYGIAHLKLEIEWLNETILTK